MSNFVDLDYRILFFGFIFLKNKNEKLFGYFSFINIYLSLITSIAGRDLPSRYSRVAPPPVDIW